MFAPSGDQYAIEASGYRAVVTESGAALRVLTHAGRPLVDGFDDDEMSYGCRGQLLVPWPNRIRDGRYQVGDVEQQLPLTEPARANSSHGLARWAAWSLEEHTAHSVSLTYRIMAQTGYPWVVDLHVLYDVSATGLTVTQTATNRAATPAPYASGAHPYLTVGDGPVDGWELTMPASTYVVTDERMLPVERRPVAGTAYDFRTPRLVGDVALDHGFTDLEHDADGIATVTLRDPATGREVALWLDGGHRWLQVYNADGVADVGRRSLAVEPMTAGADAFRSGDDVVWLAPADTDGDEHSVSWGISRTD